MECVVYTHTIQYNTIVHKYTHVYFSCVCEYVKVSCVSICMLMCVEGCAHVCRCVNVYADVCVCVNSYRSNVGYVYEEICISTGDMHICA